MSSIPDVDPDERMPLIRVSGWLMPQSTGIDGRLDELRGLIRSIASGKIADAFDRQLGEASRPPTVADLQIAARFLRRVGQAFEARLSMVGHALEHVNRAIEDARHVERQVEAAVEGGDK